MKSQRQWAGYVENIARYRWTAAHIVPHAPDVRFSLRQRLGPFVNNNIIDVVNEPFARIWATKFSAISNGRAYRLATARRLLGDYSHRGRAVRIDLVAQIDSLNLICVEPGPELRVKARQYLARLQAIVATHPVKCRQLVELLQFEELSHREVAQRFDSSGKAVENHWARALARIGAALAASIDRRLAGANATVERARGREPCQRTARPPHAALCAPTQPT